MSCGWNRYHPRLVVLLSRHCANEHNNQRLTRIFEEVVTADRKRLKQMEHENVHVARCAIEQLMKKIGIWHKASCAAKVLDNDYRGLTWPTNRQNRSAIHGDSPEFVANCTGFVYVALILLIGESALYILTWHSMHWSRHSGHDGIRRIGLVHHSDRGTVNICRSVVGAICPKPILALLLAVSALWQWTVQND